MGDSSWLRTQSVKAKTKEEEAQLADTVPKEWRSLGLAIFGCIH